jgi:hypothetical protein
MPADAGEATLESFAHAPRFNRWMYDALRPWLGVRLAELGAGRGNLSVHFVAHARVMLTDQHPTHVAMLRERWGQRANVEVHQADMTVPQDLRVLRELSPDTVVFTNVLEHIANDGQVLRDLHALVPSGCRLVVLVPYDLRLYTPFDKAVGHFRRYGEGELERKMTEAGFMVEHQQYFNKAGRLAWALVLKIARQRRITTWQLRIYDLFTPVFRVWDKVLPGPGASTIVVARKN